MTGREPDRDFHAGYQNSRQKIGHKELHRELWEMSNARRRIPIAINELARRYKVHYTTASDTVRDLCAEGRIRRVKAGNCRVWTFVVTDPALYGETEPDHDRRMRWG